MLYLNVLFHFRIPCLKHDNQFFKEIEDGQRLFLKMRIVLRLNILWVARYYPNTKIMINTDQFFISPLYYFIVVSKQLNRFLKLLEFLNTFQGF